MINNVDETCMANMSETLEAIGVKKPYLTFKKGAQIGQIWSLKNGDTLVGRANECDLTIEDNAISRQHFKIIIHDNKLSLQDMQSRNGTFVNGEKAQNIVLKDGDKIQISPNTILEIAYLDDAGLEAEKARYEKGVKDPGTGIYNKGFFLDRMRDEFSYATRQKQPFALIMFDIDHFKKLNDNFGHLLGDQCLKKLAAKIATQMREEDVFARYGGEEFAIIMRNTGKEQALALAERLLRMASEIRLEHNGQYVQFTISLGVGVFHEGLKNFEELIKETDGALYQSKEGGRNRVTRANQA